jgi:hypothetical protein
MLNSSGLFFSTNCSNSQSHDTIPSTLTGGWRRIWLPKLHTWITRNSLKKLNFNPHLLLTKPTSIITLLVDFFKVREYTEFDSVLMYSGQLGAYMIPRQPIGVHGESCRELPCLLLVAWKLYMTPSCMVTPVYLAVRIMVKANICKNCSFSQLFFCHSLWRIYFQKTSHVQYIIVTFGLVAFRISNFSSIKLFTLSGIL